MNSSSDSLVNKERHSPALSTSTVSTDTPTTSLPGAYVSENVPDDSSKLRTLLSILRKYVSCTCLGSVIVYPTFYRGLLALDAL